jgi:hypothetical protein
VIGLILELWWINLVSWTFAILAFTTWYHQTISFPYTHN